MSRNPDRPLAPHLTVWKWGPHMLVSILHRVTGSGLATVGAAALVWWLMAAASGPEAYETFSHHATRWYGIVIWVGLSTTWKSLGGGVLGVAKQMTIVVLALILGRLTGRLLHLQKGLNHLGEYAKERFSKASAGAPQKWCEGFIT